MSVFNERAYVEAIVADAVAQSRNGRPILRVNIALGEISDMNEESVRQHWVEVSRDTPAQHAAVNFRTVRAEVQCMACFMKYHPEGGAIRCPQCGSFGAKILAGEEFYLESIETEPS
jgi:hydrogenase nickel incorporation protein HypA/HybF